MGSFMGNAGGVASTTAAIWALSKFGLFGQGNREDGQ